MKKCNYHEGTVFAVPLRNSGYVRGVVARLDKKGIIFAYFYGPKINLLEEIQSINDLSLDQVLLAGMCGDLGLMKGEWPQLGLLDPWNREDFILPRFYSEDEDPGYITVVEYDDHTLETKSISTKSKAEIDLSSLCRDTCMGYGFVEIKLTKYIDQNT